MNKGGKREGAGRKQSKDPKQQIQLYVPTSEVESVGGKDAAKEIAYKAISNEAKKNNKQPRTATSA